MRRRIFSKSFLGVSALLILVAGVALFAGSRFGNADPATGVPIERLDGSLSQPPAPLSLQDVEKQSDGSAARAVVELWYWGQWGSVPNLLASYDPAVLDAVGTENVAGAYAGQRGFLVASNPNVLEEVEGPSGTVVNIEALRQNQIPVEYSFTLREQDGEWRIVFDTLLESALASYIQTENTPDPDAVAADVPAAAKKAGRKAAAQYRVAFENSDS